MRVAPSRIPAGRRERTGYQAIPRPSFTLEPGSLGLRILGAIGISLGGAFTGVGALSLGISGGESSLSGLRTFGIGALIGGPVLLAGGIAAVVTSGSRYTLEPAAPGKAARLRPRYWMGEF